MYLYTALERTLELKKYYNHLDIVIEYFSGKLNPGRQLNSLLKARRVSDLEHDRGVTIKNQVAPVLDDNDVNVNSTIYALRPLSTQQGSMLDGLYIPCEPTLGIAKTDVSLKSGQPYGCPGVAHH
ncbi:hypothetical protein J6590_059393 [Homalodisca vitripennis]|nr:hypothetical protein J6590_059393 [Homalodisca vitripennis]